jgi:hypothetical protein
MSTKVSDYLYIERWCEMMGSKEYFVADQLKLARDTNAPPTAIYQTKGGTWRTIEYVTSESTRHYFCVRGWMTPDWKVPERDRRDAS